MAIRYPFLLAVSVLIASCGSDKKNEDPAPNTSPPSDAQKQTVTDVTQSITLEITTGAMKGTTAIFPPGSVALGDVLEITVVAEQPAELATVLAGGSAQASPAGIGLTVNSDSGEAKNLAIPGTLGIVLNEGIALAEAKKENVGVLSKSVSGALIAYLAKHAQPKEAASVASVPFLEPGTFTAAFIGDDAPDGYKVYDMEAPAIASDTITAADVTTTSMTLTWTKATDDATAEADLTYKVVRSTANNITTADDAVANGTLVKDWTKDLASVDVSGLTSNTIYYFNVLVKDASERVIAYKTLTQATEEEVEPTPTTPLRMFVTSGTWEGNLLGISGADAKCMADNNKPSGSETYKAFIVQSGARVACTLANCGEGSLSTDWVLYPNRQYIRANDSVVIGATTAAAIFTFPLSGQADLDDGKMYWTGFAASKDWVAGTDTCNNWTDDFNGNGARGRADVTSVYLQNDAVSCGTLLPLLCVEQ